jgi:hypothetical protein
MDYPYYPYEWNALTSLVSGCWRYSMSSIPPDPVYHHTVESSRLQAGFPSPSPESTPTMSKLIPAEREVYLSKAADEDYWTLWCTDPAELPRYLKLAKRVGGTVSKAQGGTRISFPLDSIFVGVKRKYNLSAEQRAERSCQMKARRACPSVTVMTPA